MATQHLFEVTGPGGLMIFIEYNDANLRVGNISFTIPAGFAANFQLKNQGQIVYDAQYQAGTHEETIPGNYRLTYLGDDDEGLPQYRLPEIDWYCSLVRVP